MKFMVKAWLKAPRLVLRCINFTNLLFKSIVNELMNESYSRNNF